MKIYPSPRRNQGSTGFVISGYIQLFFILDSNGQDESITVEKRILLDTIKEYSDHTTIHGINYVFASFLSFSDRLFWFIIFVTGLTFSVYLSLDAFLDWRKNMIVTRKVSPQMSDFIYPSSKNLVLNVLISVTPGLWFVGMNISLVWTTEKYQKQICFCTL